jgi:hypothetical protein
MIVTGGFALRRVGSGGPYPVGLRFAGASDAARQAST